jgi:hypothetical protein
VGGFQVTPEALAQIGQQHSAFGANQIDHPTNNVIDRWQRGLDEMSQDTDLIGRMVVAAGKAYAQTDGDVAGACTI